MEADGTLKKINKRIKFGKKGKMPEKQNIVFPLSWSHLM